MEENYMLSTEPQAFFGFGFTRVTVWKDKEGKIYPHASGKVSKKLEEACSQLRGQKLTTFDVQKKLWPLLKENA